jgi:hypothetical protein
VYGLVRKLTVVLVSEGIAIGVESSISVIGVGIHRTLTIVSIMITVCVRIDIFVIDVGIGRIIIIRRDNFRRFERHICDGVGTGRNLTVVSVGITVGVGIGSGISVIGVGIGVGVEEGRIGFSLSFTLAYAETAQS